MKLNCCERNAIQVKIAVDALTEATYACEAGYATGLP